MNQKRYLLFTGFFLFIQTGFSQQSYSSQNKKAIKLYEEGIHYFQQGETALAKIKFQQALMKDTAMIEPYLYLGDLASLENQENEMLKYYQKAYELNPTFYPSVMVSLGQLWIRKGEYEKAENVLRHYTEGPHKKDPKLLSIAEKELRNCAFAREALQKPVPFHPINLGPAINSPLAEYFPSVTADDTRFLFTRRLIDKNSLTGFNEDFYMAERQHLQPESPWNTAVNIGPPVNTRLNEGAPSLSADGQYLFFTACEMYGDYGENRKGFGSCDLFFTRNLGNRWALPVNLGSAINTKHWESQPSFSADGKTLFFVRGINGKDGKKQQDIYYSRLQNNGTWTPAQPIPGKVNTPFTEESVFIHPDGRTLYFASDGHPGMGGLDIFVSYLQEDSTWSEPANLGYPINTAADENSLLVSASGQYAYFASDRDGGLGDLDLYYFELPPEVRPTPVTYFRGKIFDKETNQPLEAYFELIDLSSAKTITQSRSNPATGNFLLVLPLGNEYALNVSKENYLFFSENFSLQETDPHKTYEMQIPLQPIKTGESIILKNIFYQTAKYELEEKSAIELNKLLQFLQNNPRIKIEISGHTDNVGKRQDNLLLSEKRARTVYEYLLQHGISRERLSYKGYADTLPIADNSTEEGRAKNRRTEFKIIAIE